MSQSISPEEFDFRKEVLERLTRMETVLAPLANGRVGSIETDVQKLKEGRMWDRGVAAGVSGAVAVVFAVLKAYLRIL